MGLGALGMMMSEAKPASAALFGWGPDVRLGRILRYKLQVKTEPDHLADSLGMLVYDEVLPIPKMVYTRNIYGKRLSWYELAPGQYVDATWVQPVFNRPNPIDNRPIPDEGCLGQITVPLSPVYSKPNVRDIHRTFYYENNFWIIGRSRDERGFPWYEIWDDLSGVSYFLPAKDVRRIEPEEVTPLRAEVPQDQKRLVLELANQVVRAYEFNKPVWEAPVSSGEKNGSTPLGRWITNRKRPCRRMVNEPHNPNVYDLPGVPWVSYITIQGVAFHGTFWHSNWGEVMSNGCINMKNDDAKWLYRWTTPAVPFNQYYHDDVLGTRVDVVMGWGDTPKE